MSEIRRYTFPEIDQEILETEGSLVLYDDHLSALAAERAISDRLGEALESMDDVFQHQMKQAEVAKKEFPNSPVVDTLIEELVNIKARIDSALSAHANRKKEHEA